ncbi:release factor glutamine methyltransferase [Parelusimicrobium proximum]|uniref:peptide chain release factor N(5)-glutamine methyltransferase n=1 Tax=Parelusimicrobium proximum TaxID=3228953 RepID=UPI003D167CAB
MITIKELIEEGREKLVAAGIDEAKAVSEVLLSYVLGRSRTFLLAYQREHVRDADASIYRGFINEKASGRPVQYIVKEQEFLGYIFEVSPDVLIPRPETEELVLEACRRSRGVPERILDLCSGSGCIAAVMSLKHKNASVTAGDISDAALAVAKKNAANLGLRNTQFVKTDLFKNIKGEFDIIITNPPYIPSITIKTLSKEVSFEPALALDGGVDGLKLIRRIVKAAPAHMKAGGLIAMEFGYGQAEKVKKLFTEDIWSGVEVKKDMFGIERFIFAYKNNY